MQNQNNVDYVDIYRSVGTSEKLEKNKIGQKKNKNKKNTDFLIK
jgi:hypothetical protein